MDTSDYLPMFLAECREHLQSLNLAIVRLEEQADDRETIDEIFRIAHSLKGMSATMGFAHMAELTHAMEDVFDLLRQRRGGLERDVVDLLFECLDALSAAVDAIEADGAEQLDPVALVGRLHGLVRAADEEEAVAAEAAPLPTLPAAGRVLHVKVRLADDVSMPAVRAIMLAGALARHGEVVATQPAELEKLDARELELWLATADAADAVTATATAVAEVVGAEVDEAAPASDRPAQHAATKGAATVRVDAERLDQLMHLMGELVVHRTHLEALTLQAEVPGLQQAMQDLTRSAQALQAMVMQVRMIPVDAVFVRLPRLVRDLSSKLEKDVELVLGGRETELDRTVVDALGDPLVHLVRNALDHGLEPPAERKQVGKPEKGRLEIAACHQGGNVVISVQDDGRGLDPAKIAAVAVKRGLIPHEAAAAVDLQRAVELLFEPGFSTAAEMTDISGRGVGMDAVRTIIRGLGGEVFLTSEPGHGTTAQIRLPLTLAIMSALLVESGGVPFAIPLDRVERTLELREHPIRSVAGKRLLVQRDGVLPLLSLADALGASGETVSGHAVVARGGERRIVLEVDSLVGQRELVTRPLPSAFHGSSAVSGAAVLSSGEIALIVDCDALANAA